MKTMLDRGNPLYTTDYEFRDVYFIATAAEDEEHVFQRAQSGLEGWIECFPKARLAGCIYGGGVTESKEVMGSLSMEKAYEFGKSV